MNSRAETDRKTRSLTDQDMSDYEGTIPEWVSRQVHLVKRKGKVLIQISCISIVQVTIFGELKFKLRCYDQIQMNLWR